MPVPAPAAALAAPLLEPELRRRIDLVFGALADPIERLEARAQALLPAGRYALWEGDASTFQFLYVSPSVEALLGYPRARWTEEPTFWADVVLHPEDRADAVAFCALCTGRGEDHDFAYRAVHADGHSLRLLDAVRVIRGRRGVAAYLRGLLLGLSAAPLPGA